MSPEFSTSAFSILAYDPDAQEWGVAVESRAFVVGAIVPWAQGGIGAVAVQALAHRSFGQRGLALLKRGYDPKEIIPALIGADNLGAQRQLALIDAHGHTANYTGNECRPWAGGIAAPNVSVQGNTLVGERVLTAMLAAFKKAEGKLAARLLTALEAGQRAGGDKRGQQSAALLVVREKSDSRAEDRYVDLRVDDHPSPIAELRRLYEIWEREFYPRLEADRINALLRAQKYAKAQRSHREYMSHAERLARKYADDADLMNNLAWQLARNQLGTDAALKYARRGLKLNPNDENIADTLAEVHFQRGEFAQAVEIERGLLVRQPGNLFFQSQLKKFEKAARQAR